MTTPALIATRSNAHQFVTPVVREMPRPAPEPRSFSFVW
jgi:hypothetical protein